MSAHGTRPDAAPVLERLKGFQRAAVEVAFERLFLAPDSTRRFLVADEVGLGKTLIARGIVARAVQHLWDEVDRIDVVYLCSNARIARQNVRRLNPFPGEHVAEADRITMLPVTLKSLAKNKLNFVAFTPGTSLDLKSSQGQRRERALLYRLMQDVWPLRGTGAMNLLQATIRSRRRWREFLARFDEEHSLSKELVRAFHRALEHADEQERAAGGPGLRARWEELCDRFRRSRRTWPQEMKHARRAMISELRGLLARTCVHELQPDLVILDEFQRFKHLLDPGSEEEAARLASALFEWQSEDAKAHTLLLSATPYKMYTLAHERNEDDHYADFLRTVEFLDPDPVRARTFRGLLETWRRELYHLADGGGDRLPEIKRGIETHLRRVMSRTERIATAAARDGMLTTVETPGVELAERDVRDFVRLQAVADELGQPHVVEYWKSAPYLLSFMEDYKLARRLKDELDGRPDGALLERLDEARDALLDPEHVAAYGAIDPANARMRGLVADVLAHDLWRCLWIPPSLPSYRLEGSFASASARPGGATKRLVFSAWNVVPKAIAALVSYEVERRAFTEDEHEPRNTPEDRKRRAPLLRFSRSEERLTGLPVLALIYPSPTLAELGDPLRHAGTDGALPSLAEVLAAIEHELYARLAPLLERHQAPAEGPEDEGWYWQAPILLDHLRDAAASSAWWCRPDLASAWSTVSSEDDEEDGGDVWTEHVEQAARVATDPLALGRPPGDLARVLALLALAGPATVALRALARVIPDVSPDDAHLRLTAGRVGWAFRPLFNRPESMALLRAGADPDTPYWRRVLEYSAGGGLSDVVLEHLHVLRDIEGLFDKPAAEAADGLAAKTAAALSIRASRQEYQAVHVDGRRAHLERERNLRGHFAMRFSTEKSDDEDSGQRADLVRDAFNSPFWPFVLATTSVGQEGLDFHAWCHAVVHWNLPANPVDLEQREGRVHRFKGHAIRKHVARAHGPPERASPGRDPWTSLFERARRSAPDEAGGLVPYWLYDLADGARIERHVPALPLSKDRIRLHALRRSLAVYRMVFGQPRQDDLLAYLLGHLDQVDLRARLDGLRIDLAPSAPT